MSICTVLSMKYSISLEREVTDKLSPKDMSGSHSNVFSWCYLGSWGLQMIKIHPVPSAQLLKA